MRIWTLALWTVILLSPELALLAFFSAGSVLSSPAAAPHAADVVVVLGGDDGPRYARGRELLLAGYAKRMILFEPNGAERQAALAQVPNVEIWDKVQPQNSWGEAQAVRTWMLAKGLQSALVVSDPPHLLRVSYSWWSAFRGTDLQYTPIAANPPWWPGWRWWRNPRAATFVDHEVLKLGYYLIRYRFGYFL